jgi:hypothetical protein
LRYRRQGPVCLAVAVSVSAGCDWDCNPSSTAPPRIDPQQGPGAAATPPALAAGPAGERNERPSTDENMGRSFQGVIELRLKARAGQERGLRYLARGNVARLQVDGVGGKGAFDALLWGENISVIDNARDTYRSFDLDSIETSNEERRVSIDKTGDRRMLAGVGCERYEINDGPTHISACVTALAGTFSADKLEALSQLDVPGWVEELLAQQLMPLEATARDASGRELYSLELVRYAAGPVDDSMLALPSNYRPALGNAPR